jgi:DNA ligase 1
MALLADLVATSNAVAATSARSEKVGLLAARIAALAPDGSEVVAAGVSFLTGEPRQGRIGIGWASLARASDGVAAPAASPSLTVADVDAALDRLAALEGSGSQAARAAALAELFGRATPAEAEFLRQVLTGGVRQGALAGVVTDGVAKAAGVPLAVVRRAAMLAGDLPRVAAIALCEGRAALEAVGLQPLCPVQPMLASTSASVADAMASLGAPDAPVSVEWKLDGARVQAHRAGDDVRLFTRNLNDVTARLPGIVEVVRSLPVASSVVLDGEVIGLGVDDERPDPFQETMSRFGREGSSPAPVEGLVVRFFDVLHVDGEDLIDRPLTERLAVLERVAGPWRIPGVLTSSLDEAAAFEAGALSAGHEGVMVKGAASCYEAGRRGAAWRKVKPVRTLDLVVLAAEWGHGRRRGWLSNLHLGAASAEGDGGFVMVGKTFKGLTDALLTWQTEQLLAREVRREGITVFVRPELVVEIALDGVQRSTRYPGGVALRFARVKGYRPDKSVREIDTIEAVRAVGSGEGTSP